MKYSKTIAGITIEICEKAIGEDLVLTLSGGEKPHIGCVVQAVPRPSLSGDGTISVTSSVINLTGHKDEFLCRRLAENRCRETGKVVVCTGGVHMDHITGEQIEELLKNIDITVHLKQHQLYVNMLNQKN
mgnify:FL=1